MSTHPKKWRKQRQKKNKAEYKKLQLQQRKEIKNKKIITKQQYITQRLQTTNKVNNTLQKFNMSPEQQRKELLQQKSYNINYLKNDTNAKTDSFNLRV